MTKTIKPLGGDALVAEQGTLINPEPLIVEIPETAAKMRLEHRSDGIWSWLMPPAHLGLSPIPFPPLKPDTELAQAIARKVLFISRGHDDSVEDWVEMAKKWQRGVSLRLSKEEKSLLRYTSCLAWNW